MRLACGAARPPRQARCVPSCCSWKPWLSRRAPGAARYAGAARAPLQDVPSGTWRSELLQRVQFTLRYTTFVEIQGIAFNMVRAAGRRRHAAGEQLEGRAQRRPALWAPTPPAPAALSVPASPSPSPRPPQSFFDNVVRHTLGLSYLGWGLDTLLPALLHFPPDQVAVVDKICMVRGASQGGGRRVTETAILASPCSSIVVAWRLQRQGCWLPAPPLPAADSPAKPAVGTAGRQAALSLPAGPGTLLRRLRGTTPVCE